VRVAGSACAVLALTLGVAGPAAAELSGLPDGRVYEQVSSPKKSGNEAGITLKPDGSPGGVYATTAASGDRVAYGQSGPSGQTSSGTEFYSVSSRNPEKGWEAGATLPPTYLANTDFFGQTPLAFLPSADLSRFLFVATGAYAKENASTVADENLGLYRTGGNTIEPEWLSKPTLPFSEAKPEPGKTGGFGGGILYPVGGSSPDLSTVYFTYFGTLVPEDESRAPLVKSAEKSTAGPWGFYEWTEGTLRSAAVLPSDSPYPNKPDPYGAVPAATRNATGTNQRNPFPRFLLNEVSQDGSKAFFVSPEPLHAREAGTPTELYVREQTEAGPKTVLVSRDESGSPAAASECTRGASVAACTETAVTPVKTITAFTTGAPLKPYVYAAPAGSRAFFQSMDKLAKNASGTEEPQGSPPWTYEFDLGSESVTYLPGVTGPIAASSQDGKSFIFNNTLTKKIELWSGGSAPVEVASYSTPSEPEFEGVASSDGTVFAFNTNAVLTRGEQKFNDSAATAQTYRYDASTQTLACVSCSPAETVQQPVDASETAHARMLADGGTRVFFATPAKLLTQDENTVTDVYEWEANGAGNCRSEEREGGCIYLISSGKSPDPSFYLENDESGENVFFSTREGLAKSDTDQSYDVYDARVNGGFPEPPPPGECGGSCRPAGGASLSSPVSTSIGPSGNFPPGASVLVIPSPQPAGQAKHIHKPLTRAQKLKKALAACKKKKPKKRRVECEKQARRRYKSSPKRSRHRRHR
jgi:hypothetical protein